MRAARRRRPGARLASLAALLVLGAVVAAAVPALVRGPDLGGAAGEGSADFRGDDGPMPPRDNDIDASELLEVLVPGDAAQTEGDREDLAIRAVEGLVEGLVWTDVPTGLRETARTALETYRDTSPCVLLDSGYLDVSGNAWACLVQGGDWVEICVVHAATDGSGSRVATVRMDIDEWERELGPLVGEGT